MAKADDAVTRKKNKRQRKKQNQKDDSSKVSNRIASLIASKKRRRSGTRRICQGMCFSLPTPEDPFNDNHAKVDPARKKVKKVRPSKADKKLADNGNGAVQRKGGAFDGNHMHESHQEQKIMESESLENDQTMSLASINDMGQKNAVKSGMAKTEDLHAQKGHHFDYPGCPSKFLMLCLNTIQNALQNDRTFTTEVGKPFFVDPWGAEFWKCYSSGKDILETSGSCSTSKQIAWMVSTAADTIARKEKEGLSFTTPFLLFLVPSQEKAAKVRSVCKPLKVLGIHTVSLHPGASLDHQIEGMKSCEPEFLVSTPERLMELVLLKAVDISGVSLLVVDELKSLLEGGYTDAIRSIKQSISGNPQTVVFNDCLSHHASISIVQNLLHGKICRLSLCDSVFSQSACIIQSVHVFPLQEKLEKVIELLDQASVSQVCGQHFKVLFVVGNNSQLPELATAISLKGYSVSTDSTSCGSDVENSNLRPKVFFISMTDINTADTSEFELVIIFNFVSSVDDYVKIITAMARRSVNGMLHSFLTSEDAELSGPLIEVLQQCGQEVPESLRHLSDSYSSMLEH